MDAFRNELLRAMDLRITALKEELSSTFHKAMGATCSPKQISDVMTFAQYFGAIDLRYLLILTSILMLGSKAKNALKFKLVTVL